MMMREERGWFGSRKPWDDADDANDDEGRRRRKGILRERRERRKKKKEKREKSSEWEALIWWKREVNIRSKSK